MKLYTEEQVRQAWNTAYIDALALDEDDYKPNFYDDFIKTITPIELPSDEDIEEGSRNYIKGTDLDTFVERTFFKSGAKWMKEKTLNQNK